MSLEIAFYIITAITFSAAIFSGESIISYLVKEGVLKKRTSLRCLSWFALYEYYKRKKEQNGKYGFVGVIYILAIIALLIEGITIMFVW